MTDADHEFYFCLRHHAVERAEGGCRAEDRLGPYPDQQSAEAALSRVVERNEDWDGDPRWNDDLESN